MTTAKSQPLLVYCPDAHSAESLRQVAGALPIESHEVHSQEELKARLEGGQHELLLSDARSIGQDLLEGLGEPDPQNLLSLSLAELEKRHILRVLASTSGNKTRAARILGIDTKTLYNKLKSYQVSEKARQRRQSNLQALA